MQIFGASLPNCSRSNIVPGNIARDEIERYHQQIVKIEVSVLLDNIR